MKSHEVMRDACDKAGTEIVATETGATRATVNRWARPTGGSETGARNLLDRTVALIRVAGGLFPLHWLCAQFDGFFVHNPKPVSAPDGETLSQALGHFHHDHAGLEEILSEAEMKDGFTPEQMERAREKWDRMKSTGEGLMRDAEKGRFKRRLTALLIFFWPAMEMLTDVCAACG